MSVVDEIVKYGYTQVRAMELIHSCGPDLKTKLAFNATPDSEMADDILKYHGWPDDISPTEDNDDEDMNFESDKVD